MECMKQSIWGSLVTATVSVAALGIAPGSATLPSEGDEVPRSRRPVQSVATHLQGTVSPPSDVVATQQLADFSNQSLDSTVRTQDTAQLSGQVSKVGEYQSDEVQDDGAIAIVAIYPHRLGDRPAATLRVRSIPVFTVIGDDEAPRSTTELSVGMFSIESVELGTPVLANADNDIKLPSSDVKSQIAFADAPSLQTLPSETLAAADSRVDPLQEASAIAARINQLHRDSVDAEQINVRWEGDRRTYVIHADGADIVELGDRVMLADTTQDAAEDALQAANRLRRLLGGAEPLRTIEGQPQLVAQAQPQESGGLRGMASWYGPGFHGNRAASGEVFDQNEMTAAHRTLPFGTQVRVTNLNNGQSVVVRINDRGPFTGGRVIDLSAAAARAIGMLNSGVAPVRVEVMQ